MFQSLMKFIYVATHPKPPLLLSWIPGYDWHGIVAWLHTANLQIQVYNKKLQSSQYLMQIELKILMRVTHGHTAAQIQPDNPQNLTIHPKHTSQWMCTFMFNECVHLLYQHCGVILMMCVCTHSYCNAACRWGSEHRARFFSTAVLLKELMTCTHQTGWSETRARQYFSINRCFFNLLLEKIKANKVPHRLCIFVCKPWKS